jgi:hypothetical protein
MEFTDLQTILTVMVVLTAAAVVVFFDCRRKQRAQQSQRIKARKAAPPQRSSMLFNSAPLEYGPAKKLATERPIERLVATPTVSKQPAAPPAIVRETVTIQMMDPGGQLNGPTNGVSSSQAVSLPAFTLPAFTIDAALWERLVSSMPQNGLLTSGDEESNPQPAPRKPAPAIDVAPGSLDANYQVLKADAPQPDWPTGMIQQPAFQELLDGGEPFSGLVVSIGVNESDSSMWHSHGLMQSVGGYIGGLLREKDFSCRTAYDEFIVVCCGEHGAQSQRRLNHISERLWDYQLRGIATCSILFSWGGVEVQDQPLAEAVASAVDRMRQTKRANSPAALVSSRRKAV